MYGYGGMGGFAGGRRTGDRQGGFLQTGAPGTVPSVYGGAGGYIGGMAGGPGSGGGPGMLPGASGYAGGYIGGMAGGPGGAGGPGMVPGLGGGPQPPAGPYGRPGGGQLNWMMNGQQRMNPMLLRMLLARRFGRPMPMQQTPGVPFYGRPPSPF